MQETQQFRRLFEQREQQIMEEVSQLAREVARKEIALLEFEMFYGVMVPKASKEKAEKSLQKIKDEKWQEALKKAKGNEEDALFIYGAA